MHIYAASAIKTGLTGKKKSRKSCRNADKGVQMKKRKNLALFAIFVAALALCAAFVIVFGKAKTFNVVFKDGNTAVAEVVVEEGETVKAPDYKKEGYELVWMNGAVAYDFGAPVTDNLTLTAVFTAKEYTVTVVNSDGSVLKTLTVPYGEKADLSSVTPTHHTKNRLFTFKGWDTDVSRVTEDVTVTAVYDYKSLPEDMFNFTLLDDGTYEIAVKKDKDFTDFDFGGEYGLPYEHNGKPVSKIGAYGFAHFENLGELAGLTYLYVPESIKVVDAYAFMQQEIKEIEFAGLEEIYSLAFLYSNARVELPETVKYIEPYAFFGFGEFPEAMTSFDGRIVLSDDCKGYYQDELGAIYTQNSDTLVYFDGKTVDGETYPSYSIPADVKYIYPAVFYKEYDVKTLVFRGDIDTIGSACFYYSGIGEYDFRGTVRKIEGSETVYQTKGSASEENLKELRQGAFSQSYAISQSDSFTLPSGLKYIGDNTFFDTGIKEVRLDGVEYVGFMAFWADASYWKLDTIVVTNSDKYYSYEDKALIERGTGPEYNGKAGDTFMVYASYLSGVSGKELLENTDKYVTDTFRVPDGVTAFHPYAFFEANFIRHLVLPEGVRSLPAGFLSSGGSIYVHDDDGNFLGEKTLGMVDISCPSTLTEIDAYDGAEKWLLIDDYHNAIVLRAEGAKGLIFPNGCNLKKLSSFSLYMETDTFVIPASVTDYAGNAVFRVNDVMKFEVEKGNPKYVAFGGWLYEKLGGNELKLVQIPFDPAATELVFPETGDYTLTEIGTMAFRMFSLTNLVIPDTVKRIDAYAFADSTYANVTISASVEYIDDYAFMYGYGLESVTFKGTVPPEMGKEVFFCMFDETLGGTQISVPKEAYETWLAFLTEYGKKYGVEGYYSNMITF